VSDRIALARKVFNKCEKSPDGCFEWQQAASAKGYGRIRIKRKLYLTHRVVAYALGMVDDLGNPERDECVLHRCDNPRCCNPDHLEIGTLTDNMQQCLERGRHWSQR